ncbi:DUF6790 family protein [Prosthecochloris sp.]|uniref:DUF6790 family protein n=1 Tax=Prosthecochloris sp. TaxID=290513 RepID=UPI0025F89375|nr:DUF6790 family protein [Prosthecochloris sp.]
MIKLLEILRFTGCGIGVFLAYYYGENPEEILRIMTPWFVGSVAGLSAVERFFFSKEAATEKGFEKGSNYQRQNAFWFLAVAVTSLTIFIAGWNEYANLSLVCVFCTFLLLSAANHLYSMIADRNTRWQNVIRPLLTVLLTLVFWGPVSAILFKIK